MKRKCQDSKRDLTWGGESQDTIRGLTSITNRMNHVKKLTPDRISVYNVPRG